MTVKIEILLVCLTVMVLGGCGSATKGGYWVSYVENPEILLNGDWEVNINPDDNVLADTVDGFQWKTVRVPGEVMMQGFAIKHDQPFFYRKKINVPDDYSGKQIKLRFEGVYSYCRVFVNGLYVKDHSGGFTSWECDITNNVRTGTAIWLFLEVTDKADEISYASGYAKHPIGGILRNVWMTAHPQNYPEQIFITTDFDENYENATLQIRGHLRGTGNGSSIVFRLIDPMGIEVPLTDSRLNLHDIKSFETDFSIINPAKWDSEHPNLYTLSVEYIENKVLTWKNNYNVGFREIGISGKKLLVNGESVKLRGACRHDIHPTLGRISTPEYDSLDVQLALDANMNFIRTSHYPPTEYFLEQCDKYGIYVEDETAVCFVGSHRTDEYMPSNSESNSAFTDRYLSQLQEMVINHRNHPSVIIWSIGNENQFGSNFRLSYDWVKKNDPYRPVIFSYPGLVPEDEEAYDIISMHYPSHLGDLNQYGIEMKEFETNIDKPVLNDEWAHVACYAKQLVKEDPNIRDFWGVSLDSMWQNAYASESSLGGAIWGMIDEVFMLPDTLSGFNEWWGIIHNGTNPQPYEGHAVGYGEWGIIDAWRRKKPEFWNTKKAYSPVKFLQTTFSNYNPGDEIKIPVQNRFHHTNFNELTFFYEYQGNSVQLSSPDLAPAEKGFLTFPLREWDPDSDIVVKIMNPSGRILDVYQLSRKMAERSLPSTESKHGEIAIEDSDLQIIITGDGFVMNIDKSTGLIDNRSNKEVMIQSGPYLNLRTKGRTLAYTVHELDEYSVDWRMKTLEYVVNDDIFSWKIGGTYQDKILVDFHMELSSTGTLIVKYVVDSIPDEFIREIGVRMELFNLFDSLSWNRRTYWSYYPPNSLSATHDLVNLYSTRANHYRQRPEKEWQFDSRSFYYDGTSDEKTGSELTNISKSAKENIYEYKLISKQPTRSIRVLGNGNITCRISKADQYVMLYANNLTDYVDLSWGNYQRDLKLPVKYSGEIIMSIAGSR